MAISTIAGVGAGSSGTILTTGSPQSGSVIQVVNATYGSTSSTTSGTYVSTPLTASITPKFSTSKIFISITGVGNNASTGIGISIYKNGFLLFNPSPSDASTTNQYLYYGANGVTFPFAISYLDSPATTSSTTYTLYIASYNGSSTVSLNSSGGYQSGKSTITLMEIAA